MNTKIKTFLATAFLATLFFTVSCKSKTEKNNEAKTEQTETAGKQSKEYTAEYVCPMHCDGSGSDTEGTCPGCGMTYVANEEHNSDGHKHE
ncbi:MAG: heavy metal-binding domain-containing protein [Flavobacteriaceae bacterium]